MSPGSICEGAVWAMLLATSLDLLHGMTLADKHRLPQSGDMTHVY